MKIEIVRVSDRGDLENERVVLKLLSDSDIGRYLLAVGKYTDNKDVSTRLSQVYWFPDKQLKQGDFAVLFTKSGTSTEWKNKSGSTTHTFYLGSSLPVWKDRNSGVIVFETEWAARKASEGD